MSQLNFRTKSPRGIWPIAPRRLWPLSAHKGIETWYNVAIFEHGRADGRPWKRGEGPLIAEVDFHNLITTAGVNKLLDATFKTGLTSPAWYVGLISVNRTVLDGAMTASSGTLTSATASFTSGDVGRWVTVQGAGAGGANLVAQIQTYTNGTTVVLSVNATTTVSSARTDLGPIFNIADTMASHTGFTEFTGYSQTNRPSFNVSGNSIASGALSNSSNVAVFTANANGTVIGAFLIDNNTIGGTTGNLYGEGAFAAPGAQPVVSTNSIQVTTSLTLTAG